MKFLLALKASIENVRQLISNGKTEEAIALLLKLAKTEEYQHLGRFADMQSAIFKNCQNTQRNGLMTQEELGATLNKINHAILEQISQPKSRHPTNLLFSSTSRPSNKALLGLVFLLITVLGVLFVWQQWGNTSAGPFDVKVLVHGRGGFDDLILKNQGVVYLDIPGDRREAHIDNKGVASFEQIPTEYVGALVSIQVQHDQPYRIVNKDSLYQLNPDALYRLAVALFNSDLLFGRITDLKTRLPLDSVRVSIRDLVVFTDSNGYFELKIPENRQKKFQRVSLFKEGFKPEVFDSIPVHTQKDLSYGLTRIKE